MALIEDAVDGFGNGFYTVRAMALLDDNPDIDLGDIVTEWHGGPAMLSGVQGNGQIVFNVPTGESYVRFNIITDLNSTTGVPIPEPATLALLAMGGLVLFRRRRAA